MIVDIFNIMVNIFLLLSFYIMISGFAAYFNQEFNIPNILTIIIISIICHITFMKNIEGITKINNILVPILILIILIIGVKVNVLEQFEKINLENMNIQTNWIIKSIEYASYNSIILIPMLISIKKYVVNKEKMVSIISTIILFVLSITLFLILFKYGDVSNIEIPIVYIAGENGVIYKYIYGIVIVFSIYTTMISAGHGFLENVDRNRFKLYSKIICFLAIFISSISFSKLVNITYPVFGIIGLIQLINILKN